MKIYDISQEIFGCQVFNNVFNVIYLHITPRLKAFTYKSQNFDLIR